MEEIIMQKRVGIMKFVAICFALAMIMGLSIPSKAASGVPAVTGLSSYVGSGDVLHFTCNNSTDNRTYFYVQYSKQNNFAGKYSVSSTMGNDLTVSAEPGETYYYRAYLSRYNSSTKEYEDGPKTPVKKIIVPVVKPSLQAKEVKATSIKFGFNQNNITGYEIYRATGDGKYKKVIKTTETSYTDKGLKANTTYRYRLRSYVYNKTEKKTFYSQYLYLTMTTWGNSLKLKAKPLSTKSVKLSWKKVSGASGYEIYRQEGESVSDTMRGGQQDVFATMKLVKTLNNGKTVSYKDSKLTPGADYNYLVRAYKEEKGKRVFSVEERVMVSLNFGDFYQTERVQKPDGSVKFSWTLMVGAKGYKVEKYNWDTNTWKVIKTLKSNTVSITLPKASAAGRYDQYRIYAYNGNKRSNAQSIYTYNSAGKVNGISASVSGKGVRISWKPVKGASFYRVFRSRYIGRYNADSGLYVVNGSSVRVGDSGGVSDIITGTSVVDVERRTAGSNSQVYNEGPMEDVRYYYYVMAYDSKGQEMYSQGAAKPASAMVKTSVAKPAGLSVKASKGGKVTVSWKKVTGAVNYQVYYSTKSKSGYKLAGTTKKLSTTISKLSPKKKYYFKVRAYKLNAAQADSYSAFTGAKSVTVK